MNNPPAVTIIDKYNYVNQPYQTVINQAEGFAVDLFWTLQSIMNFTGSLNFPAKGNLLVEVVLQSNKKVNLNVGDPFKTGGPMVLDRPMGPGPEWWGFL